MEPEIHETLTKEITATVLPFQVTTKDHRTYHIHHAVHGTWATSRAEAQALRACLDAALNR